MKVTNLTTNDVLVNGKRFESGASLQFALLAEDMEEIHVEDYSTTLGTFDVEGDKTHIEVVVTPFDVQMIETVMPSAYWFMGFQFALAICCFGLAMRMLGNIGKTSPEL